MRDSRGREVAGRDSTNSDGGVLIFSLDVWKVFLSRVQTPASQS
ncbi:MAG: DUF397 domain-containing protein [Pseudonocardiales bacterium]|nr:DUF397 domain-containing protein [Pseudonocardiales bacterium]MBW0010846.1 DUF397 domain-containing protein [Pseudonocardiales bacterium]